MTPFDESRSVKAVADGSIMFYLEHYVTTRIAKYSYYTLVDLEYMPNDLGHELRKHNNFVNANGSMYIPRGISPLLQKVRIKQLHWTGRSVDQDELSCRGE